MSDGSTQIRPWVFFLCTGVLLIAGAAVIAKLRTPPGFRTLQGDVKQIQDQWDTASDQWGKTTVRVGKLEMDTKKSSDELNGVMGGAEKKLDEKFNSLKQEASAEVDGLKKEIKGLKDSLKAQQTKIEGLESTLNTMAVDPLQQLQQDFGSLRKKAMDLLPAGAIVAWSPKEEGADAPEGWALCNGQNGTPDLTGRFLRGVGDVAEAGKPSPTGDLAELVMNDKVVSSPAEGAWSEAVHGKTPGKASDGRWWSYWTRDKIVEADLLSVLPHFTVVYIIKLEKEE